MSIAGTNVLDIIVILESSAVIMDVTRFSIFNFSFLVAWVATPFAVTILVLGNISSLFNVKYLYASILMIEDHVLRFHKKYNNFYQIPHSKILD